MADLNDEIPNVNLYDAAGNPIHVEDISGDKYLGVKAILDQDTSFQLQPFVPKVHFNSTPASLATSPSWTTLLSVSGVRGKLSHIAIAGSTSTYRVRLTVDTVEVFSIAMSDLSAIGLSNAVNVVMWAETADKNFRYTPREAVDFTDSFLVEAQLVSGSPTVTRLITYRTEA